MLTAKEDPFEKSTPEACNTALPAKLRAPDGSLSRKQVNVRAIARGTQATHTMELKLANGVPVCCGRLGGEPILNARPGPRPAPPAPPPAARRLSIGGGRPGVCGPMILSSVRPAGLVRFAEADMPGGGRKDFAPPRFRVPIAAVAEPSTLGVLLIFPTREVPGGVPARGGRWLRHAI